MEETDAEFVDAVVSLSGNLHNAASVQAFVDRMKTVADVNASTRKNFLFDSTTPHGDVIITESSAMKPGIGWVTVHVTESIRRGVHEWAVKVDHQGETSDGSGLMLGIVPKNFSKFDSFISQGGGWCLSRAGKFYGHWRRVDNNTSVSSLVFNTGDRVVFTLDVEAARMTVKVGDRYVVGELSNLCSEVYPAVSLHYRHQHVRMEYHKIHDRHAKRLHWIERGTFPAAPLYLPLTSKHISSVPLDVYVFSSVFSALMADAETQRRHAESTMLKYPGESVAQNRLSVAMRAFEAVARHSKAGLGHMEDRLSIELTPELLRRQVAVSAAAGDNSKTFLVNCGALLMVHMLAHATPESVGPLLSGSSQAVAQYIRALPLFALAESNPHSPIAFDVLQVACENLAALAEKPSSLPPVHHARLLELLTSLAIQRGSLAEALRAARLLLALEGPDAPAMSPQLVEWLASLEPALAARRDVGLDGLVRTSHGSIDVKRCDVMNTMSVAADGQFLWIHAPSGLHKLAVTQAGGIWGPAGGGGSVRVCCSTRDPYTALQGAVSSSMVLYANQLLVHTDRMLALGIAFIIYSTNLHPIKTVQAADVTGWPSAVHHAKLAGISSVNGKEHVLLLWSTDEQAESFVYGTLSQDLLSVSGPGKMATTTPPQYPHTRCLQLNRDSVVVLGYPENLHFPGGHVTVELWIRLTGKDESKVFYQHGEKNSSGEIFLETAMHEGVFSYRGGFRHDTRGACSVTAPVSPSSSPQFNHVALVFDGRWRLFLNAEEVSATKNFAAQASFVERPRVKWTCGNGCIGQMAELRVWRCARSRKDIDRDRRRVLRGNEAGLLAYFPMTEERGCTLYNYVPASGNGYILKGSDVRAAVDHPLGSTAEHTSSAATRKAPQATYPLPCRLSQCDAFVRNDLLYLVDRSIPYVSTGAVVTCVDIKTGADLHSDSFFATDSIGPSSSDPSGRLWMLLPTYEMCSYSSPGHTQRVLAGGDGKDSDTFPLSCRDVLDHLGFPNACAQQETRPAAVALWLLAVCGCCSEAPSRTSQLFAELSVDIGRDVLRHATLLIQDHFRPVQGSASRRSYSLRDTHSPFVVLAALNALLAQLRVVVDCKLHAAALDLPVVPDTSLTAASPTDLTPNIRRSSSISLHTRASPLTVSPVTQQLAIAADSSSDGSSGPRNASSLGAMLLAVLSDMLNEDPAVCFLPQAARHVAAEILRRSIVLLFPGVHTRAQLLNDMLVPSCKLRKPSHQALLCGLIDTFTKVTEAVHMLLVGARGSVMNMSVIATALLQDAAAQCIAASTPPKALASGAGNGGNDMVDESRAASVISAVATVQLLLLSSSRNVADDALSSPLFSSVGSFRVIGNVFAFPHPTSVREEAVQYYQCLFRLTSDVLEAVARRGFSRHDESCPPLAVSFFTTVVHSAVSFLPLLVTPSNAGQLLTLLDGVVCKLAETNGVGCSSSEWAVGDSDEADETRVLNLLHGVLLFAMGWVAAFMTGIRGVDLGREPARTPLYREAPPVAVGHTPAGGTPTEASSPLTARHDEEQGPSASAAIDTFAALLKDPLLRGGLPGLLDGADDDSSSARRVAISELLLQPQLWRPMMQPADAIDRLGGPTVQAVMDHVAAAVLYLSAPDSFLVLPADERRKALASVAVACRSVRAQVRDAASGSDGSVERKMIARSSALLRFNSPKAYSDATILCLAKRHTGPLQLSNRWQWAFAVWRLAKRFRTLAEAQGGRSIADAVKLVSQVALLQELGAEEMIECAERGRAAAGLRIWGLKECLRLMHMSPRVAAETGALMIRSSANRSSNHYSQDVEGCDHAQRQELQVLSYRMTEEFLLLHSSSSPWHEQTVLDTLHRDWQAEDYAFLQYVDVPKHLFMKHCSIFDDGAASLRQESVTERTHRMTVRERAKRPPPATSSSVQEDAPKPDVRSLDEEQAAQSWQCLKALALKAANGLQDRTTSPTTRLGCQYFLEKFFTEMNNELQRCLQYASHFYYPNQDRVADQVVSLCSLVCSVVQTEFQENYVPALSSLPSICPFITRLCLFANLSVASSSPLSLIDHTIRTAVIVGLRCCPQQLFLQSIELQEFTRSCIDGSAADSTSLLGYLVAFAIRAGLTGDTAAGAGALATAVKAAHMLVLRPQWAQCLPDLARRTHDQAQVAVSHERTPDERREATLFLFVISHIITGMLSHTISVGSLVTSFHDTDNGISELVYVVDVNHATSMATVISADLENITAERDVSIDLLSNPPDSYTKYPPFHVVRSVIGPALRALLGQWIMLSSTVLGNIVGGGFMRIAAALVERDAESCAEWIADGTVRRIHDVVARRPVASPLPFCHLREVGALITHSCLKTHRAGGPAEAVSVFQLVGPDATLMSFTNELVGRDDPTASLPLFTSGSSAAVTDDLGHQCGLLFMSPKDARISFERLDGRPLLHPSPATSGGFSIEVTVMLCDRNSFDFGNAFFVPSSWGLPPAYHTIASVTDGDGSVLFALDVYRDVIAFRPITPNAAECNRHELQHGRPLGACCPISARDLDVWIHLVAIFDQQHHQIHLYRDGDWVATHILDDAERTRLAPSSFSCGGVPSAPSPLPDSAVLTVVKGLRVWPSVALQKSFVRTMGDLLRLDVALPAVPVSDATTYTFSLLDGSSDSIRCDEQSCTGKLHGAIRWVPQLMFPPLDSANEGRSADDMERCVVSDRFIPRKDFATHIGSLEGAQLPSVGYVVFSSLSGHYSRRCVLEAIKQLQSPAYHVARGGGGQPAHSPREILSRSDVVSCMANLVRYCETSSVPAEDLQAVVKFAVSMLTAPFGSSSAASPSTEQTKGLFTSFFREALGLLRREGTEDFLVEIPYTTFVPAESQQFPISVLNGGSATLSFEGPRHMDYLYVYADRQQKASLAKYPDTQGFWPEVEFAQTWLYLRPTASGKSSPARLTVHAKSMKSSVACAVVCAMLDEASTNLPFCLPIIFDQRAVSSLSFMLHTPRGDARITHLRTLMKLLQTWTAHPHLCPHDQVPMSIVLDKVTSMLCSAMRKDRHPAGSLLSVPSNVLPRVLQCAMELATAGVQLEAAWRGEPFAAVTRRTWASLVDLRRQALDPDDLPSDGSVKEITPAKIQTMTSSSASGVSWRRRGDGVWIMSCDRGCQTARGSVGFVRGKHYMEVRVPFNAGAVSVGVATAQFRGVMEITSSSLGQCANSWGFDGTRQCRLHNASRVDFTNRTKWKGKDVIGILLDLDEGTLCCTHNGKLVGTGYDNLQLVTGSGPHNRTPLYPAFSFSPTGCEVNFGAAPFAMELPAGYLPMDMSQYKVSLTAALAACVTLHDVSVAMTRWQGEKEQEKDLDVPLLTALACQQTDAFSSTEAACGRRGPWTVDLVQFDGRPRLEEGEIRASDALAVMRGNVVVTSGQWYYEVAIVGDGVLQVGWATAAFAPDLARHKGLGDDAASWAIDGCRMLARHNKQQRSLGRHPWRDGDVIGCFINCADSTIGYTFNGQPLRDLHDLNGNGTLFQNIPCAGGMVPAISVDQANSAVVMFAAEELCYLPSGFSPLGRTCAMKSAIERHFFSIGAPAPSSVPRNHLSSGITGKSLRQLLRFIMSTTDLSSPGAVLCIQGAVSRLEAYLRQQLPSLSDQKLFAATCLAEGVARLVERVFKFAALPVIDYDDGAVGSIARAVRSLRAYSAPTTAISQLYRFLAATNTSAGESIKLTINRRRALTIGRSPATPVHERLTVTIFGQIYALVGGKSIGMFCTSKKLWSVAFAGEGADDVGGPYRESIAEMCADIMSEALPLFIPSPNQKHNVGDLRDRFTLNPLATKPIHLSMLTFLGKVIAGCLRCAEPLPLYLPSTVWKELVGEEATVEDLAQIDWSTANAIRFIDESAAGLSGEELQEMFPGGFTATDSAGVEQPLFAGGARVEVTSGNAHQFSSMLLAYRLRTEIQPQLEALRCGFHRVIPVHAVNGLKWYELEHLVCGLPDFSVADLLASARFEGLTRQDRRVVFLSAVLTDFSPHERALFLRFVSGRERLHSTFRLKIIASEHGGASSTSSTGDGLEFDDEHLPHASTCFFWLSLPNYSSADVLREKLLLAIHQCHDIDADFRVREADEDQTPNLIVRQEADDTEFEDYSHLL